MVGSWIVQVIAHKRERVRCVPLNYSGDSRDVPGAEHGILAPRNAAGRGCHLSWTGQSGCGPWECVSQRKGRARRVACETAEWRVPATAGCAAAATTAAPAKAPRRTRPQSPMCDSDMRRDETLASKYRRCVEFASFLPARWDLIAIGRRENFAPCIYNPKWICLRSIYPFIDLRG